MTTWRDIRLKRSWRSVLVLVLAVAGGVLLCFWREGVPPKESALLGQFHRQRADLEEVRHALLDMPEWRRVGEWGVETWGSPGAKVPAPGDASRATYEKTVSILKRVDGATALRFDDPNPEICIVVWGWGFAGETRHISFCSRSDRPRNLVERLDSDAARAILRRSPRRQVVYRHIEGTWYLREDW